MNNEYYTYIVLHTHFCDCTKIATFLFIIIKCCFLREFLSQSLGDYHRKLISVWTKSSKTTRKMFSSRLSGKKIVPGTIAKIIFGNQQWSSTFLGSEFFHEIQVVIMDENARKKINSTFTSG